MTVASLSFKALAVSLLTLCFVATQSLAATPSIECETVWTGPSSNNDLLDCLGNTDRIRNQWRYYLWAGFSAVILLFSIFGLAVIFCCRCCGCCCCCNCCYNWVNPPTETKRSRSRCALWVWIFWVILCACAVCVLVIYGAALLMNSANKTLDNIQYGSVGYFIDVKDKIEVLLTTPDGNPPALDLSAFDDIETQINDKIIMVRDDYFKYFNIARIVSYCVGAVGVVLLLLILLFAFCRCNNTCCIPVGYSGVYFFFAIIYSLLAVVFAVIWYVMTVACGEVYRQFKREPGLSQWYLVPWCESQFDFTSLRNDVEREEVSGAGTACTELLKFCDPDTTPTYDYVNAPDKIFICGSVANVQLTAAAQCTSLDDVTEAIYSTYAKPQLTTLLCSNTTGWDYLEQCTLAQCAERCEDYTAPNIPAKSSSQQVVDAAQYAVNASAALAYVRPLMECNFIIDRLASALEQDDPSGQASFSFATETRSECSNLHAASIMLACGFFVGALMFIAGIYVLHRGSWIWPRAQDRQRRDEDDTKDGHRSAGEPKTPGRF